MSIEEHIQIIVEQLQQVLACQAVYFIPACPDPGLRHPLLGIVPAIYSSTGLSEQTHIVDAWQEERVRALCDLALQRGRMQALNMREPFVERLPLRSIAVAPLETTQGILGITLLGDERGAWFGAGEERLLYACLSMHIPRLEKALWAEAWIALDDLKRGARDNTSEAHSPMVSDQFVRSEFVSMVGHELRAPLSVIKGYAALLQIYGGAGNSQAPSDPGLAPEQQRHYLDAIMEQASLLEVLVDDLLDIPRLQRGQLALHLRAVDIGALCRQVIKLGQVRADQVARGKYHLECKLAAHLAPVWADAERLQQVLMNLLENAIKYSPEGGRIELEVTLSEEQILASERQLIPTQACIMLRDQGIGIPRRHIARLFQPFERLEQPTTSRIPGMGLGLYITRKLVEAMGGIIELQSCEGGGTNVTIRLPTINPGGEKISEALAPVSSLQVG